MFKQVFVFCMLIMISPLLSGCWFIAGGVAGYEVTQDSVQGHFDTSFEEAYQVSLKVMQSLGKTNVQDEKGGWIKTDIDNHVVALHIEKLTERTVQITVSARKYTLPKPQFARNILDKISSRLR